jgi:hypothetical protein
MDMMISAKDSKVVYFALFLLLLRLDAYGQKAKFKEKDQTVALSAVIAATESALNDYEAYAESPKGTKDGIPPLSTADFDFKTVVDLKPGLNVNLFVFTLGASGDKQTTNDLDFQYFPHIEPRSDTTFAFNGIEAPKSLYQSIVDTLTTSAREIKKAQDVQNSEPNKLDLCQLTLALSFGVTTDIQGGVKVPFQIVTVSASLDRSKQNVQQVKLAFKVKDPKNASCPQPR